MPPVTPAPSRFLIKRPSTQQSQNQTPNLQYPRGSSQFHATPRFAASTPRPSATQARAPFATPALAIKTRVPRTRSTQDIIDDSSPISPEDGSPSGSPTARNTLPEPIEFDSSLIPQSSPVGEFREGRSPKRRRISIASSEPETDPVINSQVSEQSDLGSLPDAPDENDHIISYHSDIDEDEDGDSQDEYFDHSPTHLISSPPSRHLSPSPEVEDEPNPETSEDETSSETPKPPTTTTAATTTKPPFRPGPRFKPAEPATHFHPPSDAHLSADIFSPQRRGTKYLAGGLAAELRDWLVDVKGGVDGEGEVQATSAALSFGSAAAGGAAASVVRVVVDGVEGGGVGMTLVDGRVVVDGDAGVERVRVILAGEGNIEGLGVGNGGGNRCRVVPGAVVAVAPPAWDVELGGRWAVAYRWEVVKGQVGDG